MGMTEQIQSINTQNVEIVYNQIQPYFNIITSSTLTSTLGTAINFKAPFSLWIQSILISPSSSNVQFWMNFGSFPLGSSNNLISINSSIGFNWNSNDYPFFSQGEFITIYAKSSGTTDTITLVIQGIKA